MKKINVQNKLQGIAKKYESTLINIAYSKLINGAAQSSNEKANELCQADYTSKFGLDSGFVYIEDHDLLAQFDMPDRLSIFEIVEENTDLALAVNVQSITIKQAIAEEIVNRFNNHYGYNLLKVTSIID